LAAAAGRNGTAAKVAPSKAWRLHLLSSCRYNRCNRHLNSKVRMA
jgi:hypothetical protein